MTKIRALAALAVVLAALWPGHPARAKDQLTIGISQFPSTFHPAFDAMMAKTYVMGLALRPLTAYDARWQLVCLLCERLPTLENGLARRERLANGGEGMALTFTLRADARWADGRPVTSDDVVFAWTVGRDPRSGVVSADFYRRILAVDVIDPRSFVLHQDRVTFDYNAVNGLVPLPAHVERARFAADPAQYRLQTAYDRDSGNPGLYNGPYRVSQVVQGSHVVLERNAAWAGPAPDFNRIVVKAVENSASLEAQVLAGEIDLVPGEMGFNLDQALAFDRRGDKRFRVLYRPGLGFEHLDVNLGAPELSDRRVRQALLLGLDRDRINAQLFGGRQAPADGPVNPLDGVHAADVPHYGFDPARAAALLDQAGWTRTGTGLRRNAQGQPLALEIATTAGNRSRELLSQVVAGQWRALGVETRLKTQPARVFFAETVTRRQFPHLALFAWISAPESVPRTTLHSSQIPSAANAWSGQNTAGFSDPRMDRLIDAIEVELDRPRRVGLWRELQHLYAEELPSLPLFFRADAHVLPAGLTGLDPTGHQDPTTLWVEDWRWRP